MSLRSATLYVTPFTRKDCDTAALLLGLDSADAFAELALQERLKAMPELQEYATQYRAATDKVRREWQAKYLPTPKST